MLRFRNLASGSTGNATVVEAWDLAAPLPRRSRILIDCGLGIRQMQTRLAQAGLQLSDLDAIFITHEHSDHVGCADKLVQRLQIPIWMSAGTRHALSRLNFADHVREASDGEPIQLGALSLLPFAVSHDARQPLQLCCSDGKAKLGLLTDLGVASPAVLAHLQHCHALLIECNHDPDLLAASHYPEFLRRRIAGARGHLANAQATAIVTALWHDGLQLLVGAHLSQHNNRPELAMAALQQACATQAVQPNILIADPVAGTPWLDVGMQVCPRPEVSRAPLQAALF